MYLAWGVKQCNKLDAATPFTEILNCSGTKHWCCSGWLPRPRKCLPSTSHHEWLKVSAMV